MDWFWILNCAIAFVLAVLCAGVLIPQILLISFRKSLFDEPDARKIHTSAVPRLGGLAFMPVVCFTFVLLFGLGLYLYGLMFVDYVMPNMRCLSFVACALMMLYIVGMADDLVGVRYRAKFVVQILCSLFMIVGGVWVFSFYGIFGLERVPAWFGWPFTLVVTVFIINSINLIDGIDGLASGLCSIALLCYGLVYFWAGEYVFSVLSFATLGVLVPFFYYNVFGNARKQKKIFMGDTGSLTIGMMIAFVSIHMLQTPVPAELGDANMLVVAFSPLIIPCFDVVRVYGERIATHNNPFLPDKRHIHHKLLALGWQQRRAMLCLVGVSLLFTVFNVAMSCWININLLLLLDAAIWVVAILAINRQIHYYRLRNPQAKPAQKGDAVNVDVKTMGYDKRPAGEGYNFKAIDRENIVRYIRERGEEVDIDELRKLENVEPLRIYPIILELSHDGKIEILSTEYIGAPRTVKWTKKEIDKN